MRTCVDCGQAYQPKKADRRSTRCPECRKLHNAEVHRDYLIRVNYNEQMRRKYYWKKESA